MPSLDCVGLVVQAIESESIDYLVVGALSSYVWGISRSTKDADIEVQLSPGDLPRLMQRLPDDFRLERQMELETITHSLPNVLTYTPTNFDIELFRLGEDEHHPERFRRRVRRHIPEIGREAWIPTAENVIIQKLRWQRLKDKDDARNVLAVQAEHLDMDYIVHWTQQHGTVELLHELLESIGPEPD